MLLKSSKKNKNISSPALGKSVESIMFKRLGVWRQTGSTTAELVYRRRLKSVNNFVVRYVTQYVLGIIVDIKGAFNFLS